jgi:predicted RND superfamily exporter protein
MKMPSETGGGPPFFRWMVTHPAVVCTLASILLVCLAIPLSTLTQDTRADAYLSPDNRALLYRDKVKEQFGLSDPFVIAIQDERESGVFTPANLLFIEQLTEKIRDLDNIDSERVASLSTEKNIESSADGIDIDNFYTQELIDQLAADGVRDAVAEFPLLMGNLVSADGKLALIVAEMQDEARGEETYFALLQLIESTDVPDGVALHVAGEGATRLPVR